MDKDSMQQDLFTLIMQERKMDSCAVKKGAPQVLNNRPAQGLG